MTGRWWSGCVKGQGELWSRLGCVEEAVVIKVSCGQVVVLWSGLLYTCGQEQSSVVKTICEGNVSVI